MKKKIEIDEKVWQMMINKIIEYKKANNFLNNQIAKYTKKYGKIDE